MAGVADRAKVLQLVASSVLAPHHVVHLPRQGRAASFPARHAQVPVPPERGGSRRAPPPGAAPRPQPAARPPPLSVRPDLVVRLLVPRAAGAPAYSAALEAGPRHPRPQRLRVD